MLGKFGQCLKCWRGNTAIEFAIVLPILVLFIFGTIEFGFIIFESATLQGALSTAAREGKTGYPDTADQGSQCFGGTCQYDSNGNIINYGPRWLKVRSLLYSLTRTLFDPEKLTFTATAYPDFSTLERAMAGDPTAQGVGNDVGMAGQVVVYTAAYPAPILLNRMLGLGPGGTIMAHNIVRNEGF